MRGIGGPTLLGRRALVGAAPWVLAAPRLAKAQPAPIRLGVVLPSAWPDAEPARSGAEIAAELLARRGRPLSLRFAAAAGAEAAERAATRLVEDGADLLLSACGEDETAAILATCDRRAVPLIACCANEPRLTDRGSRMIVRTAPTTSQLLGRGLGLLRDLHRDTGVPPPQRLALLHGTDAAGTLLFATLAAVLPAAASPVPALTGIPLSPGLEALDRTLARLREAASDVVVVEAAPRLAAATITAIMADGIRPSGLVAFGLAGLAAQEVLSLPGGAGEGHVTFAPWADPNSPVTAEVRSLYARRRTAVPFAIAQGEVALAVDSVLLVAETAARHPGARGPALAAALRGGVLTQKMLRGPPMRFDQRGQNIALPSVALQNRRRAPVVVLPAEWAEAAPIWPNPALSKT
jgi:branched-chain amino acid transport system substrate-binding protein